MYKSIILGVLLSSQLAVARGVEIYVEHMPAGMTRIEAVKLKLKSPKSGMYRCKEVEMTERLTFRVKRTSKR